LSFSVLGKPFIIIIIIISQKWELMWLGFLVTAREEAETWENDVFVSTNCWFRQLHFDKAVYSGDHRRRNTEIKDFETST
jgi:hypothetical protein